MTQNAVHNLSDCKFVETGPSGELQLVKENLEQLLKHFQNSVGEDADTPIALVSVLGPRQSGKSFFTNVITEYLQHNGKSWTTRMKTSGLKGFPYGPQDKHVESICHQEGHEDEEMSSGVYFWPTLFPLDHSNGRKLLLVMHVVGHNAEIAEETSAKDPLNVLAALASSALIEIIWKEMPVTTLLQASGQKEVSPYLCKNIAYLLRKTPEETIWKGCDTDKIFMIQDSSKSLHDENGVITFTGSQQRIVEKLMRHITDPVILQPQEFGEKGEILKINTLEKFLNYCVNLVNWSKGFNDSPFPIALPSAENKELLGNIDTNDKIQDISRINGLPEELMPNKVGNLRSSPTGISRNETNNGTEPTMEMISTVVTESAEEKHFKVLEMIKQEMLSRRISPFIYSSLEKWIGANLVKDNIGEIPNLWSSFLENLNQKEMDELKSKGLPEAEAQQIIKAVRQQSSSEIKKIKTNFSSVQIGLVTLCKEIESRIQNVPFVPRGELQGVFKAVVERVAASFTTSEIKNIFELGVTKLTPIYKIINEWRLEQKKISLECSHQIRNFYSEEMTTFVLPNQIYSPRSLAQIHEQLVPYLLRIYDEATGNNEEISAGERRDLERQLNNDFSDIQQRNTALIEKTHKAVKNLVFKWKSEYEKQIDEILQNNSTGLQPVIFDGHSETIKQEIIHGFMADEVINLPKELPRDKYLQSLEKYIEKSAAIFRQENEDALTESEQNANCQPGPSKPICKSMNHHKMVEEIHTEPMDTQENDLPQLLIQLGLEKIGIGTMNHGYIEKFLYASPEIGITVEDIWVCGNQIQKLLSSHGIKFFRKKWNIVECLISSYGITVYEKIFINNTEVPITTEFLVALYLLNVRKVEYEQADIRRIGITVPKWCPSVKRQQILDGAHIAGFDEVEILNESSCAAYYMYESVKTSPELDLVVLSENSKVVDISIYSFERQHSTLTVLEHFSEICSNIVTAAADKSWSEYFGHFLHQFTPFGQPELQGDEATIQKIVQLCQCTISKAKGYRKMSYSRHFLIQSQSHQWTNILTEVARNLTSHNFITVENEACIRGMASVYKTIRNIVPTTTMKSLLNEKLPFAVTVYSPNAYNNRALKNGVAHSVDDKSVIFRLPKEKYFKIFEENIFSKHQYPVAELNINIKCLDGTRSGILMEISRSQHGIIHLNSLVSHWKSYWRKTIQEQDYRMKLCTLSSELHGVYRSAIKYVSFYDDVIAKLAKEKQLLLDSGTLIMARVRQGNGVFPNAIVKTVVLNNIEGVLDDLRSSQQITESEIKQQRDLLHNICISYKLDN